MVRSATSRSALATAPAVAFQPIVDLTTEDVVTHALVTDGPPMSLREIIRDGTLEQCLGQPRSDRAGRLAVHAAPTDLADPELARDLSDLVCAWGLMPREIELRIHSSHEVGAELTRRADHLRTMGFGLTLVGFGRSSGALLWLRAIPFDRVEIAATFCENLGRSPRDKLMCAAVVDLGHRLGASVDAAGLATEAQVSFARAVGVERGRGRYWAA